MSTTSDPSAAAKPWADTDEVRHCKADALTDREFERMVRATYQMEGDYFEYECRLVLFLAGRLGLRAGEIAHLKAEWIDWDREMIEIPRFEQCTDGRDGGICGHCRQSAKQMVEHNPGVTQEAAEAAMWSPKTVNACREVPFGSFPRAGLAIEDYFGRWDKYMASRGIVNRRVTRTAEGAKGIEPDEIYPHALRATAASRLAGMNLGAVALKSMFGWAQFSTALTYIEESGERTANAIRALKQ